MADNLIDPIGNNFQAYAPIQTIFDKMAAAQKNIGADEEEAQEVDDDKAAMGKEAKKLAGGDEDGSKIENPYDNLLKSWKKNLDKQIRNAQEPDPMKPMPFQQQAGGTRQCVGGG
jgi:hypothetical protein